MDSAALGAARARFAECGVRGAVPVSARLSDVDIQHSADVLTEYRFNTKKARHYFRSVGGIYTHHQRRSNSEQYGVNIACLDGFSPFDLARVVVYDGINHSTDRGEAALFTGYQTFSTTAVT